MKYIATCSFGKDSLAQIIQIKKLGLPLDEVIYCDILFSTSPLISGEHPLMAAWIPTAEKILEKEFGIKVKHITAKKSFVEQFHTVRNRGKYAGDIYGFPITLGAWCNDRLKINPINTYISSIKENVHKYIGIAYDEQIRYERLKEKDTKKVTHSSVLYDYKITEQMAFDICREYDLISPIYSSGAYRGGCWFCVKQCVSDLYQLWRDYPNYYNMLLDLEKESPVSFKPNKTLSYYTKNLNQAISQKEENNTIR